MTTDIQKSDGQAGHTPGPWEVDDTRYQRDFRAFQNVMAGQYNFVAAVSSHPEHRDTTAANARLIAAAPELLAALIDILDAAGTEAGEGEYRADDREGCLDYVEFTARSAIRKATGQ